MPGVISPSAKEQIVRAAEQLFAERGIDGVSLRQIGVTAGNGNNSAVQYHFGSKEELIRAIFEYRLPNLYERRRMLIARGRPADLRSWVECYALPILEQGEQKGSHYLGFVAMLQQHGRRDVLEHIGEDFRRSIPDFADQLKQLLPHVPEPLRTHRVHQALAFSIQAAADREQAQAAGENVLPFAVHVSDLLDGLLGFLQAPVSPISLAALENTDPDSLARPLLP